MFCSKFLEMFYYYVLMNYIYSQFNQQSLQYSTIIILKENILFSIKNFLIKSIKYFYNIC